MRYIRLTARGVHRAQRTLGAWIENPRYSPSDEEKVLLIAVSLAKGDDNDDR